MTRNIIIPIGAALLLMTLGVFCLVFALSLPIITTWPILAIGTFLTVFGVMVSVSTLIHKRNDGENE